MPAYADMISHAEYLEALDHPDIFVRSHVLRHFVESNTRDVAVTKKALQLIDRLGLEESFEWPHQVMGLAIDEGITDWAVSYFLKALKSDPKGLINSHLLYWIAKDSPIEGLANVLSVIQSDNNVQRQIQSGSKYLEKYLKLGNQRLEIADRSAADCYAQWESCLVACELGEDFPHGPIEEATLLLDRMVADETSRIQLEKFATHWLTTLSRENPLEKDFWELGFSVIIVGELKLDALAEPMLSWLDSDWDWLNECLLEALKKLTPETTLELAASRYHQIDWGGQLTLSYLFERLRVESFEGRLHSLIDGEESDDVRVNLAVALAHYNTPTSKAHALSVYEEWPDDPERFVIAEIIYCHAAIFCEVLPEAKAWRIRMEDMIKRSRAAERSDAFFDEEILKELLPKKPEKLGPSPRDVLPPEPYVPPEPCVPYIAEQLPGRNEPCHCGSGKKFKKCCYGKS